MMKRSRIAAGLAALAAVAGLGTGHAAAADGGADRAGGSPAQAAFSNGSTLVPAASIHYSEEYTHAGRRGFLGSFYGSTPCNSGVLITGNVWGTAVGNISSFRTWSWCQANHRSGYNGTGDASGWWGGPNDYIGNWMNDRTLSVQFR
ncbi:hypothetical protein [Streptomyces sp. NPDC051211]|uniref:hypothetical protein n=1 Tax=Streptomyces sp. NPDC051211 TaxID=3154643 RepID=UPI00344F8DA4